MGWEKGNDQSYKLAQREYKTRHDWVGNMIHWELFKKLKFDHTKKWYMHNPESVLGKWDVQTSLGFWDTSYKLLATVVEGYHKAPFSIAMVPRALKKTWRN